MPVLTPRERLGSLIDGKYRIDAVLASGGTSVVFEGTDLRINQRVAVKLLKPDWAQAAPTRDARLAIEARTAAALRHRNVVQVFDVGYTADGVSYLVMELLEGWTLKEAFEAERQCDPAELLAVMLPLMGAMATAHDLGIVHRDLKPANIFLSRTGTHAIPKVLDFGIAKVLESTDLTKTGAVLGTPHYLSPEQAQSKAVGPGADVWAFGVMFYEGLSGRRPFCGEHTPAIMHRIVNEPVPPLHSRAPHVGQALTIAIDRALRRDVSARYADLRSFAQALCWGARASGVALPDQPDARGLPDWPVWLQASAPDALPTLDIEPNNAERPFALTSHNTPARPLARSRAVALASLALASLTLLTYHGVRWASVDPIALAGTAIAPTLTAVSVPAAAPTTAPSENKASAPATAQERRSTPADPVVLVQTLKELDAKAQSVEAPAVKPATRNIKRRSRKPADEPPHSNAPAAASVASTEPRDRLMRAW